MLVIKSIPLKSIKVPETITEMIKQSWKLMVILQTLYALITLTLFQFIITISNTYNNICSVWKLRVSRISCARVGQFDITYKNDLTILVVLKFSSFEMSH